MKKAIPIILVLLIIPSLLLAKRDHYERWYQSKWCEERNGKTEVVLPDQTRCDCLIDTHAIEFDFGDKWAEAIGQSLYYSIHTNKKPGIVLILEEKSDHKYWNRLNLVIDYFDLDITTWKIGK